MNLSLYSISASDRPHREHDTRKHNRESRHLTKRSSLVCTNSGPVLSTCGLGARPAGGGEEMAAFSSSDNSLKMESYYWGRGGGKRCSPHYRMRREEDMKT